MFTAFKLRYRPPYQSFNVSARTTTNIYKNTMPPLALIAADILGWSLGCGGLARGGRSNVGTPLALATAPVNDQDSSEKQD
ncbi:hypothetical protein [uncultured Psychrobacter sp.]|uniref:hypothetical protein n=1 Tax=uncultured Psychrobacter sp. TaxID=259303 RepID=UPI002617EFB4|nr:hypothetical protein [uncultured Psychrobacter sp.]